MLCGWSGCGHPACVRLKVAETVGLEVGREGSGRHRQSIPGSYQTLALPAPGPSSTLLSLSFQEEASSQMEPSWGEMRAKSTGQENPGALSVRGLNRAVWHVGTTGVGQTVGRSDFQASFWGSPQRDWRLNTLGKALARGSGCQGHFVCCCPFG